MTHLAYASSGQVWTPTTQQAFYGRVASFSFAGLTDSEVILLNRFLKVRFPFTVEIQILLDVTHLTLELVFRLILEVLVTHHVCPKNHHVCLECHNVLKIRGAVTKSSGITVEKFVAIFLTASVFPVTSPNTRFRP